MKFDCTAFDRSGKRLIEVVEADTLAAAKELLRSRGLFVTEASPHGGAHTGSADAHHAPATGGFGSRGRRVRDLASFLRQLAVLVSTGTPVVEGLASLERQTPPGRWHDALRDIRQRVEQGSTFSDALAAHPRYFDPVARSLVAAGESGGMLDEMLKRLADLARRQQKTRAVIIGAMVYPVVLIGVSIAVTALMILFVMPRFEQLFHNLGAPLPPSTKLLMQAGSFLREWWWAVLGGLVGSAVLMKIWLAGDEGRRWLHAMVLRLPQAGTIARSFCTARVARVLGVLLEGRVPLLDALRLTRDSTPNLLYQDLIRKAEDDVARGENISSTFASSGIISAAVCEAVRSGERTGQVGPVLASLADFLDEDNEVVLKSLTSLLEPLILIVLGLVVGGVALSMFLPLFDIAAAGTSGGG